MFQFVVDPPVCSVAEHIAICAGVLEFDPQVIQVKHCVVNSSPVATAATFLWSCAAQALSRGDGPRHSLHASA